MNDNHHMIQKKLGEHLQTEGYDVVDMLSIPRDIDRTLRFRALQEALNEFDRPDSRDVISYLVQIRPKRLTEAKAEITFSTTEAESEEVPVTTQIYQPDGTLNLSYLERNAEILLEAKEIQLAKNIYTTMLKSSANLGPALYGLGRCLIEEGKLVEAQTKIEESISYLPGLKQFHLLAEILIKQEKYQYAAEVMERALLIKDLDAPLQGELHKAAAEYWKRAKSMDRTLTHLRQAIAVHPPSIDARLMLADLLNGEGRVAQAKAEYENILKIEPAHATALFGLGLCNLEMGNKRAGYDALIKSLEKDLLNPTAIYHLLKCAYETKSYGQAENIVSRYVEVGPINANLLYSLAGLQFHLGKFPEAQRTVEKILSLKKDHQGAKDLLLMIQKYSNDLSRRTDGDAKGHHT